MRDVFTKKDWLELHEICDNVKSSYSGLGYPLNFRRIILDYGIENAWINKDNYLIDAHYNSHRYSHIFDKLPETLINHNGFASLYSALPAKSAVKYLVYLKKEGVDIQSIINEQTLNQPDAMGNAFMELLNKKIIDFDKSLPAFIAFTESLKNKVLPEVDHLIEPQLEIYQKTLSYIMPLYDKLGAQFCDNLYADFVGKFPNLNRAQLTKQEDITAFFKNKDMSYLYDIYPTLENHFKPKELFKESKSDVYVYEVDLNMLCFDYDLNTNKVVSSYRTMTNFFHNYVPIKDLLLFQYYKDNPSNDGRDMHMFCLGVKDGVDYDGFARNMGLFMTNVHDIIKANKKLEHSDMENMWQSIVLYNELDASLGSSSTPIKRPKI